MYAVKAEICLGSYLLYNSKFGTASCMSMKEWLLNDSNLLQINIFILPVWRSGLFTECACKPRSTAK